MARVSDAQWRKLAIAILDAVVDAQPMDRDCESIAATIDAEGPRVVATLRALIEFGAVRVTKVGDVVYLDPSQLSRDGLRAMRDVWKGEFPTKR